jgi:hypothetical protein
MRRFGFFLTLALVALIVAGCDSTPSSPPTSGDTPAAPAATQTTATPAKGKGAKLRKKKQMSERKHVQVPTPRADL